MVIKTPTRKDIEHLLLGSKNGPKTFTEWKERIVNFVVQEDMNAEMFYACGNVKNGLGIPAYDRQFTYMQMLKEDVEEPIFQHVTHDESWSDAESAQAVKEAKANFKQLLQQYHWCKQWAGTFLLMVMSEAQKATMGLGTACPHPHETWENLDKSYGSSNLRKISGKVKSAMTYCLAGPDGKATVQETLERFISIRRDINRQHSLWMKTWRPNSVVSPLLSEEWMMIMMLLHLPDQHSLWAKVSQQHENFDITRIGGCLNEFFGEGKLKRKREADELPAGTQGGNPGKRPRGSNEDFGSQLATLTNAVESIRRHQAGGGVGSFETVPRIPKVA